MTSSTPEDLPIDLARMRHEYDHPSDADPALRETDLAATWKLQFDRWFAEAVAFGLAEPNAMVVATADEHGVPSARTVLLKGYDDSGFTFFTNYGSRKGREALANPHASLVFPWFPMQRQVVVCGEVYPVERSETEEYFQVRPRGSRLGAWASAQSSVISGRAELEAAYAEAERRFPEEVPAPEHWGGFRVVPSSVEFWQGQRSRLHDRLRFGRSERGWIVERLAP